MFIAVGALAVVGGVIASHDDYSDHYNYRDHSQYSDADEVLEIRQLEERISRQKNAVEHLRRDLQLAKTEGMDSLRANDILGEIIATQGADVSQQKLLTCLDKKLEQELQADQEELARIDAAIMQINELKLGKKG